MQIRLGNNFQQRGIWFGLIISSLSGFGVLARQYACRACGTEQVHVGGVPLPIVGIGAYIALLFCTGLASSKKAVTFGSACVLGAHVAIMTSFTAGAACGLCRLAFLGLVLVFLSCWLLKAPTLNLWPPTVLVISLASVSLVIHKTDLIRVGNKNLKSLESSLRKDAEFAPDLINVIVFESENCGLCRTFRTAYEPDLRRELEGKVKILYRKSALIHSFPTILLMGKSSGYCIGLPSYAYLLELISSSKSAEFQEK